jgi:hypothetical protein
MKQFIQNASNQRRHKLTDAYLSPRRLAIYGKWHIFNQRQAGMSVLPTTRKR